MGYRTACAHNMLIILLVLCPFATSDPTQNTTSDCVCPRRFRPVCGNDGITYDNECELNCGKESNADLRLLYAGTCCPKNTCPSYTDPVCDNFGRTHENECRFHHQKCLFKKIQNKRLNIMHRGECKPEERVLEKCEEIVCDLESNGPLCDEFGMTHHSSCGFDIFNCKLRNEDKLEVQLAYHGECRKEMVEQTKGMISESSTTSFANATESVRSDKNGILPKKEKITDPPAVTSDLKANLKKGTNLRKETTMGESVRHPKTVNIPKIRLDIDTSDDKNSRSAEADKSTRKESERSSKEKEVESERSNNTTKRQKQTTNIVEKGTMERVERVESVRNTTGAKTGSEPKSMKAKKFADSTSVRAETSQDTKTDGVIESGDDRADIDNDDVDLPKLSMLPKISPHKQGESRKNAYLGEKEKSNKEVEEKKPSTQKTDSKKGVTKVEQSDDEPVRKLVKGTSGDKPRVHSSKIVADSVVSDEKINKKSLAQLSKKEFDKKDAQKMADLEEEVSLPKVSVISEQPEDEPTIDESLTQLLDILPKLNDALSQEYFLADNIGMFINNETRISATTQAIQPQKESMEAHETNNTENQSISDVTKSVLNQEIENEESPFENSNLAVNENSTLTTDQRNEEDMIIAHSLEQLPDDMDNGQLPNENGNNSEILPMSHNESDTETALAAEKTLQEKNKDSQMSKDSKDAENSKDPEDTQDLFEMMNFDPSLPCTAENCTKEWEPVCDNLSKTHKNKCLFNFHACNVHRTDGTVLFIDHKGRCKKSEVSAPTDCGTCEKASESLSVCDNQNQTHPSLCHFGKWNCQMNKLQREQRVLVHVGKCHALSPTFSAQEELCPEICSKDNRPVCDETFTEHRNLCSFQMHNCNERKLGRNPPNLAFLKPCAVSRDAIPEIVVANITPVEFECPKPDCGNTTDSLCDSQGNEHQNHCHFDYAKCLAARKGVTLRIEKKEKCSKCQTECVSNTTNHICGSDFITYENECSFKKAQCMNTTLEALFRGSCDLCFTQPCPVLSKDANEMEFVCDQNGQSRTRCEFDMLRCVLEHNFGFNLTVVHEGRCCASIDNCLQQEQNTLCGSNMISYPSQCAFEIAQCQHKKIRGTELTLMSNGSCESQNNRVEEVIGMTSKEITDELPEIDVLDADCSIEVDCGIDYSPVCGSDNVTYSNICTLRETKCKNNSSIRMAYVGECCHTDCPSNWNPVCDTDEKSHQNLCLFGIHRCLEERMNARNVFIKKYELCSSTSPCQECSKTFEPVCGTNEETFVNECELKKLNCLVEKNITSGTVIQKAYDGECCLSHQCAYEYSPVCDSIGTTHANECVFTQNKCRMQRIYNKTIEKVYKGQCCNQPCESENNPVCDGHITYGNMCKFRIAQCEAERRGIIVALAYAGECCELPQNECAQSGTVCDSDGQTHSDMCRFSQKKCVMERNHLKTISVVHSGECCSIENCHKGEEPVCDSKGGTHASMCHFDNTKCIHDKIHPNNRLHFAYNGTCCPANCENIWDPVCDQHGSVYRNQCYFKLKSCEIGRRSSSVLLETPCPERRARRNDLSHKHPFLTKNQIPDTRIH